MTKKHQHIHFIAIGGSLMHNLALALHHNGFTVTGSDDELFEPSRSKLEKAGLLPESLGWDPDRIDSSISAVILGMHAHSDNPEMAKARELNLPVFSFPEFIYQQCINKQRVVIAGSHGKSTITAMIIHVLKELNRSFDFAIGAEIAGFDSMVSLSDAPVIIIEGDEYFSSVLDKCPKFMHYQHHIGLISGIAWDHINVFPTEEEYIAQFEAFADMTPKAGCLIYNAEDPRSTKVCAREREDVTALPYETPVYEVRNQTTYLNPGKEEVQLQIFGRHNLLNLMGAKAVLNRIGVTDEQFYKQIGSFKSASKRLEIIGQSKGGSQIFRDYAHAPSKVTATVSAVKEQFGKRNLVAALELHTYSSLTEKFIKQYNGSMKAADIRLIYFNPATLNHKRLPELTVDQVKSAFNDPELQVFTSREKMKDFLKSLSWSETDLLLMSSGTFDQLNIQQLEQIIL